jgi:DNA-binding winged helix-turn-helix (wHTH) protein/tetratricopeptide (TPR) repeat protein
MCVYEFGPFRLDTKRQLLLDGDEPVAIGPKVVETLNALVEHPGDVLGKRALLDRIWPEGFVDEANLAQNIYILRKTLRDRWKAAAIETIPRRGYRFVGPVRRLDDIPPSEPPTIRRTVISLRRPWQVILAAAAVLALAGGLAFGAARPYATHQGSSLSAEAARLYEIGRYYWNLRTPDGIAKSITYFSQVVDLNPQSARGYAALAAANAIMGDYRYGTSSPQVYFARARAFADKALAIDPSSGEAYAVLGMISSQKSDDASGQMSEAISDFERAIRLDPASGPAHEWYGIALLEQGHFDAAYAELQKAADLDPLSVATMVWLGDTARLEGRYHDAIAFAREAVDLSPEGNEAYETLGLAYEALGANDRAVEMFQRLGQTCRHCRSDAAALLAQVYARTNRLSEARAELAVAKAHLRDVQPDDLAAALAAVGDLHVAVSVLRRSNGAFLRAEIANDPRFAALRLDPALAVLSKPA